MNGTYLFKIKEYLEKYYGLDEGEVNERIKVRNGNNGLGINDHVQGLILSLLSNQRKWGAIKKELPIIKSIFYNYDADRIRVESPERFIQELTDKKLGNRQIKKQMQALSYNIDLFRKMEKEYGSIDNFILQPIDKVIKALTNSHSEYKLKQVGVALAWEYLRNVGIDGAKPDVHLRRFLGSGRMGKSNKEIASTKEVYEQVEELSKQTGLTKTMIDRLIWSYCATDEARICSANPNCKNCCIKDECNSHKTIR